MIYIKIQYKGDILPYAGVRPLQTLQERLARSEAFIYLLLIYYHFYIPDTKTNT